MAKRAWVVRPDSEVTGIGPDGEDVVVAAVSLQALIEAMTEAAVMVHRAGGVASVLVARVETGLPNERVTSAAFVEWKDRTDARAQPESPGPAIAAPANGNGNGHGAPLPEEPEAVVADVEAEADGPAEAADVDESSVPAAYRES